MMISIPGFTFIHDPVEEEIQDMTTMIMMNDVIKKLIAYEKIVNIVDNEWDTTGTSIECMFQIADIIETQKEN